MKFSRIILTISILISLGLCFPLSAQEKVDIRIQFGESTPVSPWIYGKNNSLSDNASNPLSEVKWQFLRDAGIQMFRESGGNNSTKYNWKRKLSSHPDWYNNVFHHDWDFAAASLQENMPGAQGMWTLQLIGKAASSTSHNFNAWDYNQAQSWSGTGQNLCGGGLVNPEGGGEALQDGDTTLYLEEWNADSCTGILEHWFGTGGLGLDTGTIRYWNMDNEPEIWMSSHDDLIPVQPGAEEFVQRYIDVAKKARALYPGIKLVGPVPANEWLWYNWDGGKISYDGSSYVWLEYFIRRIAEEEAASGTRLLDVLDIHFYPGETDPEDIVQSHRVYFDREYVYPGANGVKRIGASGWDNTINKEYIFGRCSDWLEQYMGPDHGVTFSVTETGVKGDDPNVTAIWYASTLGEFARQGVEIFTPWYWKTGMYEVIHLFSNYGHDYYVPASSSEEEFVSVYPMQNEEADSITVFLVNRHLEQEKPVEIALDGFWVKDGSYDLFQIQSLPANETFISANNNALSKTSADISQGTASLILPPLSVSALVLKSTLPDSEYGYAICSAEAEDGVLNGVNVASSTEGYSGTGYVTGFDNDNDQLTVSLDVPENGNYLLTIRYSNTGDKTQNVIVNGGYSFPVSFPDQAGFALTKAGNHYLQAGENTVTIKKDWGWTDIDRVELYAAAPIEFDISAALVDQEADAGAEALYDLLKLQFRHRIISGQTQSHFNDIKNITGQTPMLMAGDFASYTEGYPYLWANGGHILGKDPDGSSEELIEWHNNTEKKGIISFQWHWHSPTGGNAGQNNFYTSNTSFDIRQAVIPGTQEYLDIIRDIDDIAVELGKFRDAGIPVLWRPLHEAGGGWFWWGAHGAEPCKALYNIMYDRLMAHHGLHNLIWVWSSPEENWYPGNDKVDIIGHDSYPGAFNYGKQQYAFDNLFQLTEGRKLIAMTENGPIPDPDDCLDDGAPWLYFMSWSDLVNEQNSTQHIQNVFTHSEVLTIESENIRTSNEWRSSLYPENWKPGYRDSQGRFLHDFSHAGYRGGSDALPFITDKLVDISLPPYSADNTGTADVTSLIQQALDDVGTSGGGVVYMPAGTYRIALPSGKDHALVISHNNTVLRGAGADSTFLFHDESYMRQKNVIYIAPAYASWFSTGENSTKLRFDLELPTRAIPVESVDGYQVGDQVIVRNTPTAAFIAEHGMTGMWTASAIKGVAHKRRVDSIDLARKLLVLDTPTRYPLLTRDAARVYKAKAHLQECGLEYFSIGNRENSNTGWGDDDFAVPGTGAYEVHFAEVFKFEYTENSWVRGIRTYKPEGNSLDVHVLSNCLLLNMCRHITIDSCDFQKPQYEGGGGNGYMYTLQSNDCLISQSRANDARHNYDFKYPFSNGNVIHRCRAENSRYSSDFHMYLSMSNLFDRTTLNGDWLESAFRPYGDPIHGHSSSQSVFYNSVGENYHPNRDYIVDSRQYKWGYVIGTSGDAYLVNTDPVSGTQGGYSYDSSPRDFVEGMGEGKDLRPFSLYLDQLDKRNKDTTKLHSYQLEILTKNKLTGEAIPGNAVSIYGETLQTDLNGSVIFQSVPESFLLELENTHFLPVAPFHVVIFSDTLMTILMEENKYQLRFELLDELSLVPFSGVAITVNEDIKLSDIQGKASFTVPAGTNTYNFSKLSYRPESGTLDVQEDSELRFLLVRTHADVKIRLREGSTPVNNVVVTLGGDTIISSSLGLSKFLQLPVYGDYSYKAEKDGYLMREGSFYLDTDTTIDVAMEKDLSSISRQSTSDWIRIWPNPADKELSCSIRKGSGITHLKITDMRGRVVYHKPVSGKQERINLDGFAPGTYFLITMGDHTLRPLSFIRR